MMHPPAYMNEILFGQKNFLNNKENFLLLTPYMLSHDSFPNVCDIIAEVNVPIPKKQQPLFEFNKDTLFWSIFVAVNGEQEYYKLKHGGHNMVNVMMNLKKEMSDNFNKNPGLLKLSNYRITLAKINEIKCNLMTKPMDSIESCIPCSIYFNRPIVVYFPEYNSHVRFAGNQGSPKTLAELDETIYLTLSNNKIILKKPDNGLGFELYHYEKPLQCASNYKGDELKNIYNQIFTSPYGGTAREPFGSLGGNAAREPFGSLGGTARETPVSLDGKLMKKSEYYETIMVKCSSALQTKIR
jgi:hypothetical protein